MQTQLEELEKSVVEKIGTLKPKEALAGSWESLESVDLTSICTFVISCVNKCYVISICLCSVHSNHFTIHTTKVTSVVFF